MKKLLLLALAAMALAAAAAVTFTTAIAPQSLEAAENARDMRDMQARPEPPPFTSLKAMQAEFLRRFEASPGFGLSRVVRPIFLAPTPELVWNGATYRVVPPELVGLEDDPIVYAPREHAAFQVGISTNATRREIRKLFTHRALTPLEANAILALRKGQNLVVLTNRVASPEAQFELVSSPDLLVFGALRAGKSCATCHQCDQGTLLGAFAYRLTPATLPPNDGPNSSTLRSNLVALLRVPPHH